jgi:octaprenyl-diphosphate synthase
MSRARGLDELARGLSRLEAFSAIDVRRIAFELDRIPRNASLVEKSASHLLVRGGKRLRPLLLALAARLGSGFGDRALQLAVAVELVHNATLLHDDVVDLGDRRRGSETARLVFGNAASIFAGDWLLIEALRRVRSSRVPGVLDRLLEVIDEMIAAESVQLERRGVIDADAASYFRIVEGKTASLFRWAMFAGGRAGGLAGDALVAAELYGNHLGIAFQIVDDVLDFGSPGSADDEPLNAEKSMFADLREGKMTYPLLLAIDREPPLAHRVEACIRSPEGDEESEELRAQIVASVRGSGALEDALELARSAIMSARGSLSELPPSEARTLLDVVAEATLHRRS